MAAMRLQNMVATSSRARTCAWCSRQTTSASRRAALILPRSATSVTCASPAKSIARFRRTPAAPAHRLTGGPLAPHPGPGPRPRAPAGSRAGAEGGDGSAQIGHVVVDRAAPAPQRAGRPGPGGVWAEQQVRVPIAALIAADVAGQPVAGLVTAVPQVDDPPVGQPGGVPAVAGIAEQLAGPDRVHPELGLGTGGEDL